MVGLIAHEWIARHGGSENVLDGMTRTFPTAEIRCLWNDAPERFVGKKVIESWMARTPLRKNKAAALPLMPATWALTDVSKSDFVLVSSHLFAHHIGGRIPSGGPRKYVYVHTPARYIWAPELDSRGRNILAKAASPLLRSIDVHRASQGAKFAANSEFIRKRISATWHQDATVIYPPVDVAKLQSVTLWRNHISARDEAVMASLPDTFILGASRFVAYKRLGVVIRAGELVGLPVVLAGSGPQKQELIKMANDAIVPVIFVDAPSNELLYSLYQAAATFVFPAEEDFGIMPVEAMSLGTPVVVSAMGGASESVTVLSGGIVEASFTGNSLKQSVVAATRLDMTKAKALAAQSFGKDVFAQRLLSWME